MCDPGCEQCSNIKPQICITCADTFYRSPAGNCLSCGLYSNCKTCDSTQPGKCSSCFPGSYLSAVLACDLCDSTCYTCDNTNKTKCTSCASGFVLVDSTCVSQSTIVGCGLYCASCSSNNGTYSCDTCYPGSIILNGQCSPCLAGCNVCSNQDLSICLDCVQGSFVNSTGGCSSCSSNCVSCISTGCIKCQSGYTLNDKFACVKICPYPCETCLIGGGCLTCLYGWKINGNQCIPDIASCNAGFNCNYCALGYYLSSQTNTSIVNQTCKLCPAKCARCDSADNIECTACFDGLYVNPQGSCLACPAGCKSCTGLFLGSVTCLSCS